MLCLTKQIEQMLPSEIALLPREKKHSLFHESVILAVRRSICDGNSETANRLLRLLPLATKKPGAKEALIRHFETWGKLYFNKTLGALKYSKNVARSWTNEYEAQVIVSSWEDSIEAAPGPSVFDADKEFRKVLERLKRVSEDPAKTICMLHY